MPMTREAGSLASSARCLKRVRDPCPQCGRAPEDSVELVSGSWRGPGEGGKLVHLMPHLTGPGSLSIVLRPLPGAERKARGERALCACLAFLYKVPECCRTHLDERCHPIINSYYSFYCLVRVLMLAFTCPYVSV